MDQLALLRATTQRLVNTPTDELPRIAGFLASSLANCATILNGESVKASESVAPLHRLRTRLSALLQDRAAPGRLSAAIIIKSVVEVSTSTESTHWETWARGLIGCLNKSDTWEVKRVYLLAATRIFLLTRGSATLQREVTSPLLPSFLTATLAAVKPVSSKQNQKQIMVTNPILPTVLRCWNELIQDHAATFRPFVTRIKSICSSLASDYASPKDLRDLSLKLLSSLHLCAPKSTSATEWQATVSNVVQAVHDTLDILLRGFLEEWTPSDAHRVRKSLKHNYSKEPEMNEIQCSRPFSVERRPPRSYSSRKPPSMGIRNVAFSKSVLYHTVGSYLRLESSPQQYHNTKSYTKSSSVQYGSRQGRTGSYMGMASNITSTQSETILDLDKRSGSSQQLPICSYQREHFSTFLMQSRSLKAFDKHAMRACRVFWRISHVHICPWTKRAFIR